MSARRRFLGLDIGGTKILGAVFDDSAEPHALERVPTRRDEGREAVLARAFELATRLARAHGPLAGAGIGFAGLVDSGSGVVDSSIILPGFAGVDLAARFEAALDLPCLVENDATAAGFGEWVALGRPGALSMVLLTVGTGIGGAIVIGGELYRGGASTAGEFGNTTIDWRGAECPSGNRGSLNTLASGSAIATAAAALAAARPDSLLARGEPPLTAERVDAAARRGDALAREVLTNAGAALGAGLANFINVLAPDRVALMGGVVGSALYVDAARAEAQRRAFARSFGHVTLALATLGDLTGAFGAAALARERFT